MATKEHPLGRETPTDWTHVERYPLTTDIAAELAEAPAPLVGGFNWYPSFDRPVKDSQGRYWLPMPRPGERRRGGHAIAFKPRRLADPRTWWDWYNQVSEGICVSEAVCRAASHFNRKQYQPRPLYDECKKRDGYPGEGTWVSYGFDVLRESGAVRRRRGEKHFLTTSAVQAAGAHERFEADEGVVANRWVRSVDDALMIVGYADVGYFDLLNSWGRSYPHLVRVSAELMLRLWTEDGELGTATDR